MKLCSILIIFLIVTDFLYAPTPSFLASQDSPPIYVQDLSLDEKIGQLLMVRCAQDTQAEDILRIIETCHVGGVFSSSQIDRATN